jgi:hypothetical protein
MKTKEKIREEYEHRSQLITIQLRRDEIEGLVRACKESGKVGLGIDLERMLEGINK